MYQVKVNGILMPTIYWDFGKAIAACKEYEWNGYAVSTEIVGPIYNQ